MQMIPYISQLLSGNELEEGEFKLGDLVVRVNKIKTYEKDLIVCEEK